MVPALDQFSLYFAAALLLVITPGPSIFYVAARTLAGGSAEGVASSFDTGLGGICASAAAGCDVVTITTFMAGHRRRCVQPVSEEQREMGRAGKEEADSASPRPL